MIIFLYGYYCTTHPGKNLTRCAKCKIENLYDDIRVSYVVTNKVYKLSKEYLLYKQKHLDDEILANINRSIYMMKNRKKDNKNLLLFNVKTNYCKGDIICQNDRYQYIYSIYGKNIYTHNIYFMNDNVSKLDIDSQFKAIDYNNLNNYVNLDIKYLYDAVNKEEIKKIDETKKKYKYKHKNKDNLKQKYNLKYECGSIMQYPWNDDELYVYLFSIGNSNYLISLDNCELGNFKMININLTHFEVMDKLVKESLIELLIELLNNNEEYRKILENIIDNITNNRNIEKC